MSERPQADRLCVAWGYARAGWVQLVLLSSTCGSHAVIQCSSVFPPFDDLVAWLHRLLDGRLPALLAIDEEDSRVELRAVAAAGFEGWVELSVVRCIAVPAADERAEDLLLVCAVPVATLAEEFVRRLGRWLADDYEPAEFGGEVEYPDRSWPSAEPLPRGDLRRLDLAALWARLPGGRAMRATDPAAASMGADR